MTWWVSLAAWIAVGGGHGLTIELASDSPAERQTKTELLSLLDRYDLGKWRFTGKTVIDEATRIPHSHPVLTLNTRSSGIDLLATYIHEQLHWHLQANEAKLAKANAAMKARYPDAPTGRRDGGARDHASTIMHLTNCYLEYRALADLLDEAQARAYIAKKTYYTWVYRKVLEDTAAIAKIVEDAGLAI